MRTLSSWRRSSLKSGKRKKHWTCTLSKYFLSRIVLDAINQLLLPKAPRKYFALSSVVTRKIRPLSFLSILIISVKCVAGSLEVPNIWAISRPASPLPWHMGLEEGMITLPPHLLAILALALKVFPLLLMTHRGVPHTQTFLALRCHCRSSSKFRRSIRVQLKLVPRWRGRLILLLYPAKTFLRFLQQTLRSLYVKLATDATSVAARLFQRPVPKCLELIEHLLLLLFKLVLSRKHAKGVANQANTQPKKILSALTTECPVHLWLRVLLTFCLSFLVFSSILRPKNFDFNNNTCLAAQDYKHMILYEGAPQRRVEFKCFIKISQSVMPFFQAFMSSKPPEITLKNEGRKNRCHEHFKHCYSMAMRCMLLIYLHVALVVDRVRGVRSRFEILESQVACSSEKKRRRAVYLLHSTTAGKLDVVSSAEHQYKALVYKLRASWNSPALNLSFPSFLNCSTFSGSGAGAIPNSSSSSSSSSSSLVTSITRADSFSMRAAASTALRADETAR
eukprot:284818227_6